MNDPLPHELARRWGHLQWIRQRGPREWSSECPKCGSLGHAGREWPDRFRMFAGDKPRGWCRKCGYQDFADSDKKDFHITPEQRAQWIQERLDRERSELEKAQRAIELLRKEQTWLKYHAGLTNEHGLSFWHSKGVPDWAIDYFQLGWCPSKVIWHNNMEYTTPTATIPVFAPGWELVNIRHRLINPPDPSDKYRPDRAGIPAALYLTNPDRPPEGECILVEGEIKAIVVATTLDNSHLDVVGLPGKTPRQDLLAKLDRCDRIHVILDPDATKQAMEIAKSLGKRARVVALPCKPDDAFTLFGATPRDFYAALRYGRLVN